MYPLACRVLENDKVTLQDLLSDFFFIGVLKEDFIE